MNLLIVGAIIILTVIFDYNDKRWGWLKSCSKPVRVGVISCYVVISFTIYFALSLKYIS